MLKVNFDFAKMSENMEFEFNVAVRPQRPYGLLGTGRGAKDVHLDFHTAPEL